MNVRALALLAMASMPVESGGHCIVDPPRSRGVARSPIAAAPRSGKPKLSKMSRRAARQNKRSRFEKRFLYASRAAGAVRRVDPRGPTDGT